MRWSKNSKTKLQYESKCNDNLIMTIIWSKLKHVKNIMNNNDIANNFNSTNGRQTMWLGTVWISNTNTILICRGVSQGVTLKLHVNMLNDVISCIYICINYIVNTCILLNSNNNLDRSMNNIKGLYIIILRGGPRAGLGLAPGRVKIQQPI